jgi:hypothetical protein
MPQNPVVVRRASLTAGSIFVQAPIPQKLAIQARTLLRCCITAGSKLIKREN